MTTGSAPVPDPGRGRRPATVGRRPLLVAGLLLVLGGAGLAVAIARIPRAGTADNPGPATNAATTAALRGPVAGEPPTASPSAMGEGSGAAGGSPVVATAGEATPRSFAPASPPAAWADVPSEFRSSRIETVRVGGRELRVVVTDTPEVGLMGVSTLGSLDGMLFDFPNLLQAPSGMWMHDVPIPLDVAFFDSSGALIGVTRMATCPGGSCPIYTPGAPARWAIEAPAGRLGWIPSGARLMLP